MLYRIMIILVILFQLLSCSSALQCGNAGRPAYGRVMNEKQIYNEGDAVSYACDNGYYMVGSIMRRCLPNGTWTGTLPVCDTTLSPIGYTSSSEALSLYPPDLAVDGNKRTCFYSNRRKPRWWRMDMGERTTVISVAITVPFAMSEQHITIYVIETNGTKAKYNKCATFQGIFSSQALILVCAGKGVTGQTLHIEDNLPILDYFGLCEVEVFVRKDNYQCGKPEIPVNSYFNDATTYFEFFCQDGYKLESVQDQKRRCMANGQWSGRQPICREVLCPWQSTLENGYSHIINSNAKHKQNERPSLGSKLVIFCKPGYNLVGNNTRICGENGTWIGDAPKCQPVTCGDLPNEDDKTLGGKFKLINGTSEFESVAELVCHSGVRSGIKIHCREDGTWSPIEATCTNKYARYFYNRDSSTRETRVNWAFILSATIGALLLAIILLVITLFRKKIIMVNWGSASRSARRRTASGRSRSWMLIGLRRCQIGLRRPFSFKCKLPIEENQGNRTVANLHDSTIKSTISNLDNIYEEITGPIGPVVTIAPEYEERMRKAALIAAEIESINELKRVSQTSTYSPGCSSLYAKIDFTQKRKERIDRLEKERLKQQEMIRINERMRKTVSSPGAFYDVPVASSSNKSYLIRDDLIYAGHGQINVHQHETNQSTSSHDSNRSNSHINHNIRQTIDAQVYGLR